MQEAMPLWDGWNARDDGWNARDGGSSADRGFKAALAWGAWAGWCM